MNDVNYSFNIRYKEGSYIENAINQLDIKPIFGTGIAQVYKIREGLLLLENLENPYEISVYAEGTENVEMAKRMEKKLTELGKFDKGLEKIEERSKELIENFVENFSVD